MIGTAGSNSSIVLSSAPPMIRTLPSGRTRRSGRSRSTWRELSSAAKLDVAGAKSSADDSPLPAASAPPAMRMVLEERRAGEPTRGRQGCAQQREPEDDRVEDFGAPQRVTAGDEDPAIGQQ